MKVGVNLINFGPGVTPQSLSRWAQLTETLGYHSIMTSDHIATTPDVQSRYPAPFYEPLSTLGWLAGVTQSIAIGTTVIIVPYRNPLETARALANAPLGAKSGRSLSNSSNSSLDSSSSSCTREPSALRLPEVRACARTRETVHAFSCIFARGCY